MKKEIFVFVFLSLAVVISTHAQRRDYMTVDEIEIVRNNQDVDLRISALSRMVDRRFAVLGIETGAPKPKKSEDVWGEEPKGSKLELLTDIRGLLEKAIDDIDSLAGRMPEKMKEERKGENIFNKAVRSLSASAGRWLPQLKKEHAAAPDEKVFAITAESIELCEQIIEAATRLK